MKVILIWSEFCSQVYHCRGRYNEKCFLLCLGQNSLDIPLFFFWKNKKQNLKHFKCFRFQRHHYLKHFKYAKLKFTVENNWNLKESTFFCFYKWKWKKKSGNPYWLLAPFQFTGGGGKSQRICLGWDKAVWKFRPGCWSSKKAIFFSFSYQSCCLFFS